MRAMLVFALIFIVSDSFSQYYFNDMVTTQASNDRYKLLRANKIKKVTVTSYDADNSRTEGFGVEEEISMDGKRIISTTATQSTKSSVTNHFYDLNKLRRTQSYYNGIDNKTEYTYNDKGLIQKIVFTTTDTATKSVLVESHEWSYNETGQPVSMLKIKNRTDTTVIELVKDENGLVVEERWKKKNRLLENYYYYYDANKHLTDIVRYNTRLKKLLPDFQYEYDGDGRITKMTQVAMNTASYIRWQYAYNNNGLKQKEVAFDKNGQLIGRVEYIYE